MIVVAGEALVDVISRRDGSIEVVPGGGPFNAARAIGRLGVPVAFAGALSIDDHGAGMARSLAADGVSLDLVQRTERPTTRAFAELDDSGEARYRFDVVGTSAPALDAGALLAALPPDVVALHVGTLGLVFEPIAATIETLVAGLADDVILVVDPNCRPSAIADLSAYRARLDRILARADVVKLSTTPTWRSSAPHSAAPVVVVTDAGGPVRVRVRDQEHEIAGARGGRRRHRRGGGHLRRRDARVARRTTASLGRPWRIRRSVLRRCGSGSGPHRWWSSGPAPTRRPSPTSAAGSPSRRHAAHSVTKCQY